MQKVKPKKALGQHFLTDLSVASRIASTLDAYKGVPVLEIGPGMGVLTRFLIDGGHDVKVVEIDDESVDYLKVNFPELDGRIIEGDFLKMDLASVMGADKFCVIGNSIPCCSGMLQREVAERLAAGPGSKVYGILSVLLQAWYDVEYLFTVDENVFNPPPKVKSGVIRCTRNGVTDLGCDERLFKLIVKTSFGQRRKTLRNSLRGILPAGIELDDDAVWKERPEQLSVADFISLTNKIAAMRGASAATE